MPYRWKAYQGRAKTNEEMHQSFFRYPCRYDAGIPCRLRRRKVKIAPTAARSIETEVYETADFSITIPKGWVVTTGGENIYHSIRVYDPEEPMNQMFSLLKADVLLHSQAGKRRGSIWPASAAPALRFCAGRRAGNSSTEGFIDLSRLYRLCDAGGVQLCGLHFPHLQ